MKLGLYGGSFNPIHWGHLRPLRRAREALGLDRLLYLPTAHPPHKRRYQFAPAWARYAMVELALLSEEGMFASAFEMQGEVAYTVDTLEHFRGRHPRARLFLVLGSDSFARLTAWREWRRILELAELAVLTRPGEASAEGELAPELAAVLASGRARRIFNEPVAVSSTAVRRALATGLPETQDLVPPLVLDYIRKYGLYRSACRGPESS